MTDRCCAIFTGGTPRRHGRRCRKRAVNGGSWCAKHAKIMDAINRAETARMDACDWGNKKEEETTRD